MLTFGPVAVFGGDRVTVVITDVRLAGKVCVKRRAPCRLDVFCLRREGLVFRPAKLLSIHNLGVRAVCRPRASPRRRCRCRGTFVRDPCPSPGSCRPSFLSADFAPFLGSTSTALESRAAFAVCHDDCFGLCAMLQNEHAVSDTNDSVQNTCKPNAGGCGVVYLSYLWSISAATLLNNKGLMWHTEAVANTLSRKIKKQTNTTERLT